LNIRQYHLHVPDFSIDNTRLCQILFQFNLALVGRDAHIVHDDIDDEFQRLNEKLSKSSRTNDVDFESMKKSARLERHLYLQFSDLKQQDLLLGQRRTCLVYENKATVYARWFLTENSFWIMTCIGLSWIFRLLFACLMTKSIVPIYVELEGAMPLPSSALDDKFDVNKRRE
jgi:hypothetical protein